MTGGDREEGDVQSIGETGENVALKNLLESFSHLSLSVCCLPEKDTKVRKARGAHRGLGCNTLKGVHTGGWGVTPSRGCTQGVGV